MESWQNGREETYKDVMDYDMIAADVASGMHNLVLFSSMSSDGYHGCP
jgi:hypothetical protein